MLRNQPSAVLSVSQLNRQVKQLLETQYSAVPVQGEISTLSRPASGHIYFTLKDQSSQIRCAMFKSALGKNKYLPKQGDEVVVFGRISLYEGRGDYQLIASQIKPVGEGALQAAFFQMKDKLDAEGLFEASHKKPLPCPIQRVGIVTSATGAALHDITTVLNRRFPAISVVLYPALVQGNEATQAVCQAIETANRRNEVDILIVGRGGGSLEDLWCFNTEPVARAIFKSKLPIISAVGHEVDISISDFVADLRAATPSQAAEMISPDQFEIMQRVDQLERRLGKLIQRKLADHQRSLSGLASRLKSPTDIVTAWQEKLSSLTNRLTHAMSQPLQQRTNHLSYLEKRLNLASPAHQIQNDRAAIEQLNIRLEHALEKTLEAKRGKFTQLVASLNILSPLSTLDRGYSITRKAKSQVLQNTDEVQVGDEIDTQLNSGTITSTIKSINK